MISWSRIRVQLLAGIQIFVKDVAAVLCLALRLKIRD